MNLASTDRMRQDELYRNGSQGEKIRRELFCVTGKDSDYIDIEDLY